MGEQEARRAEEERIRKAIEEKEAEDRKKKEEEERLRAEKEEMEKKKKDWPERRELRKLWPEQERAQPLQRRKKRRRKPLPPQRALVSLKNSLRSTNSLPAWTPMLIQLSQTCWGTSVIKLKKIMPRSLLTAMGHQQLKSHKKLKKVLWTLSAAKVMKMKTQVLSLHLTMERPQSKS